MIPERAPGVLSAKQPAPLQDWYNLIDKIVERSWEPCWHQVESVSRACEKPLLQAIGNEFGRAAQQPMAHGRGGKIAQFA